MKDSKKSKQDAQTLQNQTSLGGNVTDSNAITGSGNRVVDNSIKVGDINNAKGVAIGHNAKVTITENSGASADEIAKAIVLILQKVNEMHDGPSKIIAQTAVQGLETEAKKGEQAKEENVSGWFQSLAQMAPDIWDVAVDTFINPIKGLSTVFQKIAKRAKEEKVKQ
jgi:hypothetical protein